MTDVGQAVTFFNSAPLAPYMQRWQFSVQQQLSPKIVAEVSYVGNRGTHIETSRNLNAIPLKYLSTSPVRDNATISYLTANLPNPFGTLLPQTNRAGTVIQRSVLLTAYPQFDGVTTSTNEGYSWYHSLQSRIEKRFSSGFTLQGTYTLSKFMEARTFLNAADARPERVISDQDSPHRFSASGIYELPFGRGRRWAANVGGASNLLIGGWQVQGIFVRQSGYPIGFGNAIFRGDLKNVPLPSDQRGAERWFNVNAGFERDSRLQLDYNIRTLSTRFAGIRTDSIRNSDLSVIKNVRLREETQVQFRGEFLNAFNQVVMDTPNTTPSSTAFGSVTAQRNIPRRIQLSLKLTF